jgi:DNA-binding response OmpR family regulator
VATAVAGPGQPSAADPPPLAGYTVAVTSDRRRHKIANAFESMGARTVNIQAVQTMAQPNPEALMNELVLTIADRLPGHALLFSAAGCQVEVRGQALVIDGTVVPIQPGPIAVLRALARRPGWVLSSADIRGAVPSWESVDDHAIEMAISRLRRSLAGTRLDGVDLIQTVMRRGYRLSG